MFSRVLTLPLVLLPLLAHVQAGIFDKDSPVKMLDSKTFKKAMAQNRTAVVAFVAPWCGHCQRLSPEYEKAAKKLAPLVPLYAVDCDAAQNKGLCASQNVKGFPTIKSFKKGGRSVGSDYTGERTNTALYSWAKDEVPQTVFKVRNGIEGVSEWNYKNKDQPRALLLNKSNKLPLLWSVLSNQYSSVLSTATVRDRRGKISKSLGFPHKEDHKKPKIVLYEPGKKDPILYEGLLKYDALATFLGKFAKGEADLSDMLRAAKDEKDAIPERKMREEEAEALMQGRGYNPHAHGAMPGAGGGDPHAAGHHGAGGSDHPHAQMMHGDAGAGAQHHFSGGDTGATEDPNAQSEADFSNVEVESDESFTNAAAEDEKEMGDDDEETAGEIGRDRNDDL